MESNSQSSTESNAVAVLLVEDELPTSLGLQAELRKRGFAVDIAKSASEASKCLSNRIYSAIVLDLILPNDDPPSEASPLSKGSSQWAGVEVLRRIRHGEFAAKGSPSNVPVFVLTCVLAEDTRKEIDALAVEEFFSKPEDLSIVAERIKLFLQRSRAS